METNIVDLSRGKWNTFISSPILKPSRRKEDFEPYCEPFRAFNSDEFKSFVRLFKNVPMQDVCLVSYQALPGGFTICNILLDNKLYSGCSHCIKSDRWLPIRGKMQAFRRALEQSGGVDILCDFKEERL